MGRDVGRHTDRDTLAAVDQQVREAAWQHMGFLGRLVKVRVPVNRVLLNVGEHLARHLGHPGLGITVGGRGVAVNRTKVALAVNQRIPQAEILRQADHRVIHARVAVRVEGTQHRADGIGRFPVGVAGVVAADVHRIQDAPVHRLQAVAHIGQRAGDDDRHRIVQERGLNLFFDIAHNDLRAGPRHHNDVFFHKYLT